MRVTSSPEPHGALCNGARHRVTSASSGGWDQAPGGKIEVEQTVAALPTQALCLAVKLGVSTLLMGRPPRMSAGTQAR